MTKSMRVSSNHGKIMKWISDPITRTFNYFYNRYFLKNKLGVSFDNSLTLNKLTSALPPINTFYSLADDVASFEVIGIDLKENLLTIRETGTETEFPIDPELFIILFVRVEENKEVFNIENYR